MIVTQHGKGSFVAASRGLGFRLQDQELDKHLDEAVRLAALLGIRLKELEKRLRDAADRLSIKERT